MRHSIRRILLFTILISIALTGCDNKKEASVNNTKEESAIDEKGKTADGKKMTNANHSFEITLVKESETIEYSDAVPNNQGGAIYNDQKSFTDGQEDRNRTIMMFIGKKYNRGKAGVFGIIRVNENWSPFTIIKRGDKTASTLYVRPKENGDEFIGISGTLNFSNLKFALPVPITGAASFTLDFEGDFLRNGKKEDVFKGSGTIVISPNRQMGTYEKK
ncbi:hypothetical protein ACFQ3R_04420 [Mesonia ostreae]|uniref:Lipoprotein n=1 Tax=Mesonia ostreae TaxID=861110 RepID=A0ABU2KIQ6_9FLAO|nr:hypothetical protein [Mesonia ostreae]MDT0294605.1 hypothetical protein [Mesonia ostreae]